MGNEADLAEKFYEQARRRRSCRAFSSQPIDISAIEFCVRAACTAPSGANLQPWYFAIVVSPDIKRKIRRAAETVEKSFYEKTAPAEFLEALRPLGTSWQKPFLEDAPVLIVVFSQKMSQGEGGLMRKTYYPTESTAIAAGILITALNSIRLRSLTHTPCPMNFLNDLLGRPKTERPILIVAAGMAADEGPAPLIPKKTSAQVYGFY